MGDRSRSNNTSFKSDGLFIDIDSDNEDIIETDNSFNFVGRQSKAQETDLGSKLAALRSNGINITSVPVEDAATDANNGNEHLGDYRNMHATENRPFFSPNAGVKSKAEEFRKLIEETRDAYKNANRNTYRPEMVKILADKSWSFECSTPETPKPEVSFSYASILSKNSSQEVSASPKNTSQERTEPMECENATEMFEENVECEPAPVVRNKLFERVVAKKKEDDPEWTNPSERRQLQSRGKQLAIKGKSQAATNKTRSRTTAPTTFDEGEDIEDDDDFEIKPQIKPMKSFGKAKGKSLLEKKEEKQECCICNLKFSADRINEHVNQCLDKQQ